MKRFAGALILLSIFISSNASAQSKQLWGFCWDANNFRLRTDPFPVTNLSDYDMGQLVEADFRKKVELAYPNLSQFYQCDVRNSKEEISHLMDVRAERARAFNMPGVYGVVYAYQYSPGPKNPTTAAKIDTPLLNRAVAGTVAAAIPKPSIKRYVGTGQPVVQPRRLTSGSLVTADDYPPAALRAGASGKATVNIEISAQGAPTSCTVSISSGNASLDAATCSLVMRRARFAPATDAKGKPTSGTYSTSINWALPN